MSTLTAVPAVAPLSPPVPAPVPAVRYSTAVDWLHALGDVPLDRIVCDPMPGSATEADILRWIDGDDKRLVELVTGTLVEKPMGAEESEIAAQVILLLKQFVKPHRLGSVFAPDATLRVRASRVGRDVHPVDRCPNAGGRPRPSRASIRVADVFDVN